MIVGGVIFGTGKETMGGLWHVEDPVEVGYLM